jgi:hypothetical protein
MHWPRFHFLAIVAGESIRATNGSFFVSTSRGARIETVDAGGIRGLRVSRQEGETLFLPLGGTGKGSE